LVLPGFVGLQIAVSQAQHGSLQLVLTRSAQHVADDVVAFRLAVALDIAQHRSRHNRAALSKHLSRPRQMFFPRRVA